MISLSHVYPSYDAKVLWNHHSHSHLHHPSSSVLPSHILLRTTPCLILHHPNQHVKIPLAFLRQNYDSVTTREYRQDHGRSSKHFETQPWQPTVLESMIRQQEGVKEATAFGDQQFELGVIVEPVKAIDPNELDNFKTSIWSVIEEAGRLKKQLKIKSAAWKYRLHRVIILRKDSAFQDREAYKALKDMTNFRFLTCYEQYLDKKRKTFELQDVSAIPGCKKSTLKHIQPRSLFAHRQHLCPNKPGFLSPIKIRLPLEKFYFFLMMNSVGIQLMCSAQG